MSKNVFSFLLSYELGFHVYILLHLTFGFCERKKNSDKIFISSSGSNKKCTGCLKPKQTKYQNVPSNVNGNSNNNSTLHTPYTGCCPKNMHSNLDITLFSVYLANVSKHIYPKKIFTLHCSLEQKSNVIYSVYSQSPVSISNINLIFKYFPYAFDSYSI